VEVARPVRRAGRGNPPAEKQERAPRSDPYTYIRTRAGWVYAAFIIDAYSKYIVGWQTATTLRASLAVDALEMALATRRRQNPEKLIHHSDRGSQYLSVRYTNRLAESQIVNPPGFLGGFLS